MTFIAATGPASLQVAGDGWAVALQEAPTRIGPVTLAAQLELRRLTAGRPLGTGWRTANPRCPAGCRPVSDMAT